MKAKLTFYIFSALILGVLVGWLFPEFGASLKPLADVFLRMVKMIIAPLVFSTLVVGIAGHGGTKNVGKLAFKTILYFEIATTLALVIGLAFANYFQPGAGLNLVPTEANLHELEKFKSAQASASLVDTFTHIVPTSVVDAMARGDILQVVVFAVVFAIALGAIGSKSKPIFDALHSLAEVMFKFTEYVMLCAPIGVFAAIAHSVGVNGIGVLGVCGKLVVVLYCALIVFVATVLWVACIITKVPFFSALKAIKNPALLAFSTASSEAALPKAMETMEQFGVPKKIVSFVMPTGYTFNLDGTTLYLALATLFVAQLSGIHLSIPQQIIIMLTLMITSKGVAAVPRVSLVILTGTLISFNIPLTGVAVILGIDQILDMGRTTVNLIGNCIATIVIARWENCFDDNKMHAFIAKNSTLSPFTKIKLKIKEKLTGNISRIPAGFHHSSANNASKEKTIVTITALNQSLTE